MKYKIGELIEHNTYKDICLVVEYDLELKHYFLLRAKDNEKLRLASRFVDKTYSII